MHMRRRESRRQPPPPQLKNHPNSHKANSTNPKMRTQGPLDPRAADWTVREPPRWVRSRDE
eukprot:174589-Pyramimonas_sp.AAC.1